MAYDRTSFHGRLFVLPGAGSHALRCSFLPQASRLGICGINLPMFAHDPLAPKSVKFFLNSHTYEETKTGSKFCLFFMYILNVIQGDQ